MHVRICMFATFLVSLASLSCEAAIVETFGRSLSLDPTPSGSPPLAVPVDVSNEIATSSADGAHSRAGSAQISFLSAAAGLGGVAGIESFESIPLGSVASVTPLALTAGSVSIDLTVLTGAGAYVHEPQYSPSEVGRYPTSGSHFLQTNNVVTASYPGPLGGPDTIPNGNYVADFTFTFSTDVAGFGFYATDLGDHASSMLIEAFDSSNSLIYSSKIGGSAYVIGIGGGPTTTITQSPNPGAPGDANGSLSFLGIYNQVGSSLVNSIASVRIRVQNPNGSSSPPNFEYVGLDDLIVITADASPVVPEPASAALAFFGLAAAYFGRRRLMAAA